MPAPTFRMADGAYRRRHTQVPPYEYDGLPRMVRRAGTSSKPVRHKAAVHHPLTGWERRPSALPGIAPSADGALRRWGISRRARRGCFAGCGQRVFRPLRRATGGAAPWTRDLGNAPPVGKRCRQGILRQSKVQLCSHTGCMARSCTAAMAQKARRHPQTHRWQVATQKKIE